MPLVPKQEFPLPSADCANFLEKLCPGELNRCVSQWCGDYLACACQCAEGDMNCYAACGFTVDCDMSLMQVQECGLGIDRKLMVHPGSPCFPPME